MTAMTGYQQGILYLVGSQQDDRFCVRNIDKHYIDAVADVFSPKRPYLQTRTDGGKDFWAIKSPHVTKPALSDVEDAQGFARAFIELQSTLDWATRKKGTHYLRLRIYGAERDLEFLQSILPAKQKRIQHISSSIAGGYVGRTCALYYQSSREVRDVLSYIDGYPRNENVWKKWNELLGKEE